ncbi:DNA-binding transcriptional ArsR family regulator [Sinorhizobium fredii]
MQPLSPEKHEEAEIAAGFLSAMANPKRLLILDSLVKEEMAVGALANKVGLSQSALSPSTSRSCVPRIWLAPDVTLRRSTIRARPTPS